MFPVSPGGKRGRVAGRAVREADEHHVKYLKRVIRLSPVIFTNDYEMRLGVHTCGLRDLIPSMGSDP